MSCHTISYHFRPEEAFEKADRSYTAGSLYDLEMVRDEEGMWRIEQWEVRILWTTGDPGVLGGKAALDEGNEYVK